MKLSLKFCGAVLLLLSATLGGTAFLLISHEHETIQEAVRTRASTVLSFGESCRSYTREVLAPAVRKGLTPDAPLIFEAESATRVVNGVFDRLREQEPLYGLREASLNPLNPADRATPEEEGLIRRFQADRDLIELADFTTQDGVERFYVARPIPVKAVCLHCHGSPAAVPPELVKRYGDTSGYNWQVGEVNSLLMVTVPSADVRARQAAMRWKLLGVFGLLTGLLLVLVTLLFEVLVHRRLRQARRVMEEVSRNPTVAARIPLSAADELGTLGQTFNRMADAVRDSQLLLEERVAERTQELAQAHANLQAIVDAATEAAVIATDLAGVITLFNSGAERLLGYRAADVVGKQTLALFHVPDEFADQPATQARSASEGITPPLACASGLCDWSAGRLLERARQGGHEVREWTWVRQDGSRLTVNLAVTGQRTRDGRLTGFLAIGIDVTERRRAAEALREARDAAEVANRAKSEFLANMSHEIRTPMNGIIGMTDLALDTDLTPEQRDHLRLVKDSADALLVVIDDILDFSKIEAGKLDLHPAEFWPRPLIADILKAVGLRARARNLGLTYHIAPDVPDVVFGDPQRLRQVLINLVGNAIKFTERGEVVVEVRSTQYAVPSTKDATSGAAPPPHSVLGTAYSVLLHFSVRDTGIGIPADKLPLIFDPFTQADGSITRKYGGTGLGLTISSRLVAMMGGRIWAESVPGQGSTFHFTACLGLVGRDDLRRAQSGARSQHQAADCGAGVSGPRAALRILLAEDNLVNQTLALRLLEKEGHEVVVVNTGAAALAAVKARPFDLVLMDVQMPELDGLEATAAIRAWEQGRGAHVPIVAMTARAMKGDRETCLAAGMDGYVSKPIQPEELRGTIRAVLGLGPGPGGVTCVRQDGTPACTDRSATPAPFDPGPALCRVAGNQKLLRDLLRLFLHECPGLLGSIREGLDRDDAQQVREAAHALKGSAANFVSGEVVLAAQALERLGATGDLSGGHAVLQSLEGALQQLCRAIERWLGSTNAGAVAR